MAKFSGIIGFSQTEEQLAESRRTGIWDTNEYTERQYYGDILENRRRWSENQDSTNDDITIDNQFSILADSFALENIGYMRYICYSGIKWKISNVNISYPRLILTTGGVFNA